jgi:hypothetical protein
MATEDAIIPSPSGFLRAKTQIGSMETIKTRRSVNYTTKMQVLPTNDASPYVQQRRKEVLHMKHPDIFGVQKRSWSVSTEINRYPKKPSPQQQQVSEKASLPVDTVSIRERLLKVRAGLGDVTQKIPLPSAQHTPDKILETQRFLVAMTGKGPIGKTGCWINSADERGVMKHCCREDWNDWNNSTATHDDLKAQKALWEHKEKKRMTAARSEPRLNKEGYVNPTKSIAHLNDAIRESKVDNQALKDEFKRELKQEFPKASEERLQAIAARLVTEKLANDEKLRRFPQATYDFRPNNSLTVQDRRYKVHFHPGTWSWSWVDRRYCWSCCSNFDENARGCECKVKNPDRWCTQGFEGSVGLATSPKRIVPP